MFGYKLIKIKEIENLELQLAEFKSTVNSQAQEIVELNNKIKEHENTIENLTKTTKVKNKKTIEKKEDLPVKKVRRKTTKKNIKKED